MAQLLHIDASIQGEGSVTRRLTARAADAWRETHPDGTVVYRDLGADPVPHLDSGGGLGRLVPPHQRSQAQRESWALTEVLVGEIAASDAVLLGFPLYNYGAPSSVKAWVDHLHAPGLSFDPETGEGLLGGRDFVAVVARGGGYSEGAPKQGWDHATAWLPHGLAQTGLVPRFVSVELTLAAAVPAMSGLVPMAEESRRRAESACDAIWSPETALV